MRSRIKSLRHIRAGDLIPHEKNWRTHDNVQRDKLISLVTEIGWVGACIGYESNEGIVLLDGHLRATLAPDEKVPVILLDVTEDEALKVLATFDPIGELAQVDDDKLQSLLREIGTEIESAVEMLAAEVEIADVPLKQLPRLTWVLFGIPTSRWPEAAETIERLAEIDNTILEMTSNNGPGRQQQSGGKASAAAILSAVVPR